jgi:hypothetical protein
MATLSLRNVTIKHHKENYWQYTFYCLLKNISCSYAYKQKHEKHKTSDANFMPKIQERDYSLEWFGIQSFKISLYGNFILNHA